MVKNIPTAAKWREIVVPAFVEAGQAMIAQIRLRASRGVGIDDAQMKAYSPGYARQKQGRGRDVSVRNLSDTGSMLRAIHLESVQVDGPVLTISIGFADAFSKEKARWNHAIDRWWGASPNDRKVVIDLLRSRILKRMKEK